MNKEQSNMDNLLRDKLGNHQVEPPAHVWKGVQGQMNALRRKKIIAFYSRVAAAAVVVLAFLAGWYFNGQNQNEKPGMVQNESVRKQPNQNVPALNNHADDTLKKEQDVSAEEVKPLLAENNPVNQDDPSKSFETNDNQISGNQHKPLNQITLRQDDNLNGAETGLPKLENIEAEMVYTKELTLAKIEKPKEAGPVLTTEDKLLIASNSRTTKENRAEKSGWKMGLTVSPGYSSFESGHSGSYAQNMTYQSKEGIANVGGGVSVQYKTGKKWRVESGVYYAQNGQKSGNSNNLFAFDNNEVLDYAPQLSAGNAYFNTAVRVAGSQIAMNSTAGVIEFDKLPAGAVLAANPELNADYSNTLLTSGQFTQVFDFVEIPLYLRYLLIDSKLDIEVLGGIIAGLVVGNNAFMESTAGIQNIGKTRDISSLNMSGTLGIGMNYALGKKISLAVEPRFNYFLNSLNTNPEVTYRPYRIGVYTGLYYDF